MSRVKCPLPSEGAVLFPHLFPVIYDIIYYRWPQDRCFFPRGCSKYIEFDTHCYNSSLKIGGLTFPE